MCSSDLALGRLGAPLVLRSGDAADIVAAVARDCGASAVHWNALYDPGSIEEEARLTRALDDAGIMARVHAGSHLLHEPLGTIKTKAGEPFQVFTPFWRACLERPEPGKPLSAPKALRTLNIRGETLAEWGLLPSKPDWAAGLRETWTPGEDGAAELLGNFIEGPIRHYERARDIPGEEGTSRLSPYLHFGEISPQIGRAHV